MRGNSSADKAKKPYKIKFEDKQKPFGMKSDKTWILLANYGDWTLIRSMVAWDLGKLLDGLKWTPDSRFAELFLNGKYMGSYQIVQSIKIDGNRVNVNKTTGQVIEFDPHWKEDGVPGMIGKTGMNYAWKDPDEFKELDGGRGPRGAHEREDLGDEDEDQELRERALRRRRQEGLEHGPLLHARPSGRLDVLPRPQLGGRLLPGPRVHEGQRRGLLPQQLLLHEQRRSELGRPDEPERPDKFFMGPIWDFDRSAGAKPAGDTSVTLPTGWWVRGNGSPNHDTNKIHWFTRIAKDPRFLKALHDRWAAKKAAFEAVGPTGVSTAVRKIAATTTTTWASRSLPTIVSGGPAPAGVTRRRHPHTPVSSPGFATGTPIATPGWTPSSSRRLRPSRTEGSVRRLDRSSMVGLTSLSIDIAAGLGREPVRGSDRDRRVVIPAVSCPSCPLPPPSARPAMP